MNENIEDKLNRIRALVDGIENLAEQRNAFYVLRAQKEDLLKKAEDKARAAAFDGQIPVSKIQHHIKRYTEQEREEYRKADANWRVIEQKYQHSVEMLNAVKFEVRTMDLVSKTNL